jgi:hypothetical protein
MEQIYIDYFSVGLAALLYTLIYSVWYSKWLFGIIWSRASEIKESELNKNRWARLFWNFILGLVISYFIAFFQAYLGVTAVSDGMFVGFCLWLGFAITTLMSPTVWIKRSMILLSIEGGAKLLTYVVMSGIIGA